MRFAWAASVLLVIVAVAWLGMLTHQPQGTTAGPSVTVAGETFAVEVARTEAARELGLGMRDSLPAGRGMLFVFDSPGNWGFWMKDTRFPLDMVWVRGDGTVINVARNVATSTYAENPPVVFYPTTPDALYVLEVNAGAAAGIEPGQTMTINR